MLIDGDNASPSLARKMIERAANHGIVTVRRIYGDWTTPNLGGWKKVLASCAIQPIQQFANTFGKNATDSAMIIDAMDLLHSGTVDGFCLASSDGDYTRLAVRMREAGVFVMGIGKSMTPQAFVTACELFVYTHQLQPPAVPTHSPPPTKTPATPSATPAPPAKPNASTSARKGRGRSRLQPSDAIPLFNRALKLWADKDGWVELGTIGTTIQVIEPGFDVRRYGLDKLSSLVSLLPTEFAVRAVKAPDGNRGFFIRRRDDSSHKSPALAR